MTYGALTITPYAANQIEALMLPGFSESAQGGIRPFDTGLNLYGRVA